MNSALSRPPYISLAEESSWASCRQGREGRERRRGRAHGEGEGRRGKGKGEGKGEGVEEGRGTWERGRGGEERGRGEGRERGWRRGGAHGEREGRRGKGKGEWREERGEEEERGGEERRGEEGREGEGHMKEQIVPIVVPTHQRCPVVGLEGGEVVGRIEATGPHIFVKWVAMEIEDQQG